jgi:ECF transporter S component (folate family)
MNIRKIAFIGLFIAIEIVLTRFLSIQTPIVRIGFTFLPIALTGIMFGPLFAGLTAALADIVGMMLFPTGGAFFPGFTISALLTGVIYGLFLYRKPKSFWRISLAVIVISVFVHLGLDTLWLWMLTGKGIFVLLPARMIKSLIMLPIQILTIQVVWRYLSVSLGNRFSPEQRAKAS